MTDSVNIAFKPETVARFRAAMLEASAVYRKTAPQAIKWAGIRFLTTARGKTKVGRKLRDIREAESTGRSRRYEMEVWAQGWTAARWVPISAANDPARQIKTRGAARNSWNGCFRAFNKPAPPPTGWAGSTSAGSASTHYTGDVPYALIVNELSYLPVIHPSIMDDALRGAAKGFEEQLMKQARKALDTGLQKAITV